MRDAEMPGAMPSDPPSASDAGLHTRVRSVGVCLDREKHRAWMQAILHLDAALAIFDRIGEGRNQTASNIESARVHARKALRQARGAKPCLPGSRHTHAPFPAAKSEQ